MTIEQIIKDVEKEVDRAISLHQPFNSPHEGYAVLLEKVDELWDEVKKNHSRRDKDLMRTEAIHAAAMAIRFIKDCCNGD